MSLLQLVRAGGDAQARSADFPGASACHDEFGAAKRGGRDSDLPKTVTAPHSFPAILAQVAETGSAVVDQKVSLGLYSIGLPILDDLGEVIAAHRGIPDLGAQCAI